MPSTARARSRPCAATNPAAYLKVITSLIPKDLSIKVNIPALGYRKMSDARFIRRVSSLRQEFNCSSAKTSGEQSNAAATSVRQR